MQVAGDEAISFGTRITPDFCLILMRTNFLDMGVCRYMLYRYCSKNSARMGKKVERAEEAEELMCGSVWQVTIIFLIERTIMKFIWNRF